VGYWPEIATHRTEAGDLRNAPFESGERLGQDSFRFPTTACDFEVVDFKTDDPIEQLREQLDVDIAVNLHWTWSYGSEMEEMRRLYEKGKDGPRPISTGTRRTRTTRGNDLRRLTVVVEPGLQ